MLVLLSWLNELAPLGDDVDAIADTMNELGLAVEEISRVGAPIPGVVTARVLAPGRHPDADRVHLVYVDAGDGAPLHIWCGAFNMAGRRRGAAGHHRHRRCPTGGRSPGASSWASPATGCCARPPSSGWATTTPASSILPPDSPLGRPLHSTPSASRRTSCSTSTSPATAPTRTGTWAWRATWRRVSACRCSQPSPTLAVTGPERGPPSRSSTPSGADASSPSCCRGIEVGPSPPWMAERLTRAGMRPINNVVDVINYVMLELDEPNHAYDLDTLGGGGFRIRRAVDGETMVTLDGVERTFTTEDLLICDAQRRAHRHRRGDGRQRHRDRAGDDHRGPRDGVVRARAGRRHRGRLGAALARRRPASSGAVDPYGIDRAVARFVELLRETCPELVVHAGLVDARGDLPPEVRAVRVRPEPGQRAARRRHPGAARWWPGSGPIGFTATLDQGGILDVNLPSWRPDCRARGRRRSRRSPVTSATRRWAGPCPSPPWPAGCRRSRPGAGVVAAGALRPGHQRGHAQPVPRSGRPGAGPASIRTGWPSPTRWWPRRACLRTSLRPGLLKAVAFNASHRSDDVALFEIGHVYRPADERRCPTSARCWPSLSPAETDRRRCPCWTRSSPRWASPAGCGSTGGPGGPARPASRVARLGSTPTAPTSASVGEVDPGVLDAYDIPGRLAWLELDLSTVLALEPAIPQWRPVSRFPSSDIDLAFVAAGDLGRPGRAGGDRGRGRRAPGRGRAVRRLPRARASSRGSAAWPSGCACSRPTTR